MGMISGRFCAFSTRADGQTIVAFRHLFATGRGWCFLPIAAMALSWFLPLSACAISQYVELDYNLTLSGRDRNTVFLELFEDKPQTTANFLSYVNAVNTTPGVQSNFNGTFMHRLSRNFVIQGGGYWPSFIQEPSAPQCLPRSLGRRRSRRKPLYV